MRCKACGAAFLVAASFLAAVSFAGELRRPNVIIILTDDQGSMDLGVYGSKDLMTPNVDRLANRGVRFTQFYAASAICSPSRAALLTGRYPWLVGVPGNTSAPPPEISDQLNEIEGRNGLAAEAITLAELLREAGYVTAHIGKWHLGWGKESRPRAQGFDYSFGNLGGCIDNYGHFFYWDGPNRHDLWQNGTRQRLSGRYFPDLMLEKAKAFITLHRDQPFFIYFAANLPHYPYQSDAHWNEDYAKLPFPRKLYAAALSALDERIGNLLSALDQNTLRDQTIVIFQSDHGHSVEARAHHGGGSNGPYRGAKFSLFEGGIRVPAIISWPGTLPAGVARDQLAHSCDWFPTVAELCRIKLPSSLTLNGLSLADVIRDQGTESPHKQLLWRIGKQQAVRRGDWKLIRHVRDSAQDGPPLSESDLQWFLSNPLREPGEPRNLVSENPGVFQKLRAILEQQAD